MYAVIQGVVFEQVYCPSADQRHCMGVCNKTDIHPAILRAVNQLWCSQHTHVQILQTLTLTMDHRHNYK